MRTEDIVLNKAVDVVLKDSDDVVLKNIGSSNPFISQLYSDLNNRLEEIEDQDFEVNKITFLDTFASILFVIAISVFLIFLIIN
ncbi:hypothetical protein ACFWMS_27645 [Peribacillus butanolivorans]|uniref:hypothetical protein n=1 Tax=Peribacillus butanolivorans TaxID=421767 RepID=UPI0036600CE3